MIEIKVNGKPISFAAGDVIDLGPEGLIRWYKEPLAEAQRIVIRDKQEAVCRAIAHTRRKILD